ncbi:MAG: hypothetical protein JWO19_1907 [Bryobacterales bacterium]|nr:hypothetical protein [Bryobacterales bacterium]
MRVGATGQRRILLGLAAFAMAWAIVRAHVQAITMDEAVTYVNFVLPTHPAYWTGHANNHVLNSMLAWIFTRVFGTSPLVVRSGALIGAAIFILASYFISTLLDQDFLLRLFLFVCLVFNPFTFDFLVAARGYGLASGFLLSAICLVAYAKNPQTAANSRSLTLTCGLASVCVALSFVSNFSFALVDAATIVMLYLWASGGGSLGSAKGATPANTENQNPIAPRSVSRESIKTRLELAIACFLPGLLVAGTLAGSALLHWTEPLTYGATHLAETFVSLYDASFPELTPSLSDLLFVDVPGIILPMFGAFAAWRVMLLLINWRSLRNARSGWLLVFGAVPIVAVAAALIMHSIVFRLDGMLLPKDRTGIYIVFLSTLFLGILAAVPIPTRAGEVSRRGLTILMVVLGSYFLLCLRLNYFKEWKFDQDTDKIYAVLAYYNHACGLKDVAVNWHYDGSMNYYRVASGRETFPRFPHYDRYPPGQRAYVFYAPDDRQFLASHALSVVYQSPSGAVVALDPAIDPPPGEGACVVRQPDQSR